MNKYCFILKLLNPSPKYGCKELNISIKDINVYYARKNVQFQYPDYKIVKIVKESNVRN